MQLWVQMSSVTSSILTHLSCLVCWLKSHIHTHLPPVLIWALLCFLLRFCIRSSMSLLPPEYMAVIYLMDLCNCLSAMPLEEFQMCGNKTVFTRLHTSPNSQTTVSHLGHMMCLSHKPNAVTCITSRLWMSWFLSTAVEAAFFTAQH